jgi:limonene-1,2-epoxide hydrolase
VLPHTTSDTDMSTSDPAHNLATVDALCQALTTGDMESALPYLADDVHYHNMPWAPLTGARAVIDFLQPFVDGTHCTLSGMRILHAVGQGAVVMNAREETWERRGLRVVLPVAGLFELVDGRIARWCDYWDLATFKPMLDAIAVD